MKTKLNKGLLTAVLVLGLLLPGLPAAAQEESALPQMLVDSSELRPYEVHPEDTAKVTLITGDVVTVTTYSDGEASVAISPADPSLLGQSFYTFSAHGSTYVVPRGVDLQKLDRELFNIDYLLAEQYHEKPSLPLLVTYSPALAESEVEALADAIGVLGREPKLHREVYTMSTRIPYTDIVESYHTLVSRPEVEKVWLDKKVYAPIYESVPMVGAEWWWDATNSTGEGVHIAILDTGIDSSHPALQYLPGTDEPKVIVNENFTDDATHDDLHGHGTHCAGIAAGSAEPPSEGSATATPTTFPFTGTESSSIAGFNDHEPELDETQDTTRCSSCSPDSSMSSESSVNSDWSTKPVIVNIQINLESEEDQIYIHEILSEIESHGWTSSVFVTGQFASEHPEVLTEIEKRGHYIGVYGWKGGEDLSVLSYSEQLELMKKSISAVRSAVSKPKYVVDFRPQNLKYNDDTIRALQDLGMKSMTATFSADESFVQCPYAKSVGKVTFPYPITTDFMAVPISYVKVDSEDVLLDDKEVFSKIAPGDYLHYLEAGFDEHNETKDPMVMVISPSVTGADETRFQVLSEFLDYIEENDGKVKPTAPITVLTRFITSLDIVSAPDTANPGQSVTVTTEFTAAIYCPSYYLRVYGKYPTENEWRLHAEHYHGVQTGTFSFSRSFTIPEPPAGDSSYTIRVVGQGCAGTCWPTPYTYEEADEVAVNIVETPVIEEIIITPTDPVTTKDVTLEAKITDAPAYEIEQVLWTVVLTDRCAIVWGNPGTVQPPAGTHGNRQVVCQVSYRNTTTGETGTTSRTEDFKLFFERDGDEDGDGVPNWFKYWGQDGAVPDLVELDYDSALGDIGRFTPPDELVIGPHTVEAKKDIVDASGDFIEDLVDIPEGIAAVADTCAHELYHKEVYDNWHNGWRGQPDSDRDYKEAEWVEWNGTQYYVRYDDGLPDFYETNVSHTSNETTDTHDISGRFFGGYPHYAGYGDQEYMARVTAKRNAVTNPEKDWANPGEQTRGTDASSSSVLQTGTLTTRRVGASGVQQTGFTGEYSDEGVDIDGDGLYDYLAITAGLNITNDGLYGIVGWLDDTTGNGVSLVNHLSNITSGTHLLTLYFDGYDICHHRMDGPYSLSLALYDFEGYEIDSQYDVYNTSGYSYTDFHGNQAWFANNYSDHGIDTDDDGLYNHLAVELGLDVTLAGDYTVEGWLYDSTGKAVMVARHSAHFDAGEQTVELLFDGLTVHRHRANGPYSLKYLRLYDENGSRVDFIYDAYHTSAYSYTDFEWPAAYFGDVYSDYGVDTTGDGLYESLVVDVGIDVTTAGNYTLTASLYDENRGEIVSASSHSYLTAGSQSVLLNFDGMTIYEHVVDGPYDLSYPTLFDEDGVMVDYRSYASCTTSPYSYTQFSGGGVLTGAVTDDLGEPVRDTYILAIGPATASAITDTHGGYHITRLPSGSYTIRAEPVDPNLMTASVGVYLPANETVVRDFTLQAAGSIAGNITDVNGKGIPDLIVYLSGYETPRYRTDENGSYVIPRLQAGTHTVNVDATGTNYPNVQRTVDVTLGDTTIADFVLEEPHYQGVAPGAWLWNVKVLNQWGWGYESSIIEGIEFASLGPDGVPGTGDEADVISMSLGGGPTDGTDPMSQAVNLAVERGVVVVAAAGNSGPQPFTILSPGVAESAITVGATDKWDNLAYFSSCGPTIDWRVKPDLVAPGVDILSSVPGDGYEAWSGTSMATPHVAGAAALLLQHYGTTASSQFIKDALTYTAQDLGYSIYEQGGGRLDLEWEPWPTVGVTPANLSMGLVTSETMLSGELTFFNDDDSPHDLTVAANLTDSMTGDDYSAAVTLEHDSFAIPAGGEVEVGLGVDLTGLPHSLFEGKIIATVDDGGESRTIHAIFGFAQMSEVTVHKIDIHGEPAHGHPLWVLSESPYYEGILHDWVEFDEFGSFTFYAPEGTYHFVSPNWGYEEEGVTIWTIAENVVVSGDTTINLDERETVTIDFDPNSEVAQIPAGKGSSLHYCYEYWDDWCVYGHTWSAQWWYPDSFVTRVSPITRFDASFTYNCYASEDFQPDDPDLINTSQWYNLRYSLAEIANDITFVADRENLVRRHTSYCVALDGERAWWSQGSYDDIGWWGVSFWYAMDAPQTRTEWLSPEPVRYYQDYERYWGEPGNCWYFSSPRLSYPAGEYEWRMGAHPFTSDVNIWVGWNWLDIWGFLLTDSYGSRFYNWCAESPSGYIRVTQDGEVVLEEDIWNWVYWWAYFEETSHFTVEIWGETPLPLSRESYTRLDFTADPYQYYHLPRVASLRVPGMDLFGVVPGGEVEVMVRIVDEGTIESVSLAYSVDDGHTWNDAGTPMAEDEWYVFSLGHLEETFVDIAVDAQDEHGTTIHHRVGRAFRVGAVPPLRIITEALPDGGLGVPYEATLEGYGGVKPYTWEMTDGDLPPGLDLDVGTGVISGTPDEAGTFDFTVQVTDDEGTTATGALSMLVFEWIEFITDPEGDQFDGYGPDIVGIDFHLDEETIYFRVRTAEPVDPYGTVNYMFLDLDLDASTGFVSPYPELPTNDIGADAVAFIHPGYYYYATVEEELAMPLQMPGDQRQLEAEPAQTSSSGLQGELWLWDPYYEDFHYVGAFPVFTVTDSFWCAIPLHMLDDDGIMAVVNLTGHYDWGLTDVAPDEGHGLTATLISGVATEVDCQTLPDVTITLLDNGDVRGTTISDEHGNYTLVAWISEPGEFEVVASREGFRDERRSTSLPELLRQYELNFRGDHGLIPDDPDLFYVLECIDLWLYPPDEECGLTLFRVLDVIDAWLYPIIESE